MPHALLTLPKNIYIVSVILSLCFATTSLMVLVSGLLGTQIATNPQYATLPMAMMVIGTAISSIPAALIMQRIGRKRGMATGILVAVCGAALAFFAARQANFTFLLLASLCFGFNAAFIQQGRFVIMENARDAKQSANGLTLAFMANLVAAFIGPQLGASGKNLIASPYGYAGSFALLGLILMLALLILTLYKEVETKTDNKRHSGRPITTIIKQPGFVIAAGSAALAYGIMSLIMTATPISMHEMCGHSLSATKSVIQMHIIAMFLPSLLTGYLLSLCEQIKHIKSTLFYVGLASYIVVAIVGLNGVSVAHFWWSLALLGIGWNLIFVTSTALLPDTYHQSERFKAQATNDFIVFSFQAVSAFSAGWLLFNIGWQGVLWVSVVVTLLWMFALSLLNPIASKNKQG